MKVKYASQVNLIKNAYHKIIKFVRMISLQIFSSSMAVGIQFYQNKNYDGFDDCQETIKFTLLMNNLFDALNRKFSGEGIKKDSPDLEVS